MKPSFPLACFADLFVLQAGDLVELFIHLRGDSSGVQQRFELGVPFAIVGLVQPFLDILESALGIFADGVAIFDLLDREIFATDYVTSGIRPCERINEPTSANCCRMPRACSRLNI
jgi:hypothetical protein